MSKPPSANRSARLFADAAADSNAPTAAYRANIDGGSRGNPGPASYGVIIRNPRGEVVAKLKKYIGRMTNNVAEYYGLIAALDYAQSRGIRALRVESDSELLVRQMRARPSHPSKSSTSTATKTPKPTPLPTKPWTKPPVRQHESRRIRRQQSRSLPSPAESAPVSATAR